MKFAIIGERSKVGQSILNYLKQNPSNWECVDISDSPDYLFLATSSQDSKIYFEKYKNEFKIVDFSNAFKEHALKKVNDFSYGFLPLFDKTKKHIAFTGCSSLASLMALNPVKEFILENSVFIDVKFSKSFLIHTRIKE
jgi:N-acetyl-gamma-glutamylphosphate reductase